MEFDLVIRHGTLVTASDTIAADLGIRGEHIAAVGKDLRGQETIDADGLLVLPGGVDPHVHLEMTLDTPAGQTVTSDSWATGTLAAAWGGTTTVIDFVEPMPDESLCQALDTRRAQAEGRAAIDFGLHMTLNRADEATLAELPNVLNAGVTSFKTYTTYVGLRLSDEDLLRVFKAVGRFSGLVLTHAENDALISWAGDSLLARGLTGPAYYAQSRPAGAEAEAIERALALAECAEVPLYVVHISTARGAQALQRARARGQVAWGETCPQYLWLTEAEYARSGFEGAKFVCAPPLRRAEDRAALWTALAQGHLQSVGTDHCAFNFSGQKDLAFQSTRPPQRDPTFAEIPGGLPGVEARLALVYTGGVQAGRLTLNGWVDVCCAAPARLFGLFPRKGTLAPGSDADVVLFDPHKTVTLSQSLLHENVDYSPYEGLQVEGYPVTTIARGKVLVRSGQFVGQRTGGQFLKRNRG